MGKPRSELKRMTQGSIGNDHLLVDAYHLAEAFALWAGTDGRVEGKELVGRLLEGDAVGLEACTELVLLAIRHKVEYGCSVPFVERCFAGIHEACDGVAVVACRQAVDN